MRKKFGAWDTYRATVDVFETRFPPGHDIPEKMRYFLSGANPGIWRGEVSADPAIYGEFRHIFEAMFPDGEAAPCESADVVEDFLASIRELYRFADDTSGDSGVDLLAVFDEVTD